VAWRRCPGYVVTSAHRFTTLADLTFRSSVNDRLCPGDGDLARTPVVVMSAPSGVAPSAEGPSSKCLVAPEQCSLAQPPAHSSSDISQPLHGRGRSPASACRSLPGCHNEPALAEVTPHPVWLPSAATPNIFLMNEPAESSDHGAWAAPPAAHNARSSSRSVNGGVPLSLPVIPMHIQTYSS
jgi:hypothetical protein